LADNATWHPAAVDGYASRAAFLDGNTNGDRRPETAQSRSSGCAQRVCMAAFRRKSNAGRSLPAKAGSHLSLWPI